MNFGTCSRPYSHPMTDARWMGSAFLTIACVAAACASSVRPSSLLALVRTVGIGDGAYPMNTLVRLLEDWTTYQDYLWFLACLAWGAIAAAEIRWKRESGTSAKAHPERYWVLVLALSGICGALLELSLLVQSIWAPYVKFDIAMGTAQAIGVGALASTALTREQRSWLRWSAIVVPIAALAFLRTKWPLEAGGVLALVGAVAAWRLARAVNRGEELVELEHNERPTITVGLACYALYGALATHGPIATLAREPRITTDLSHFALPAVLLLSASGALIALPLWREHLRRFGRIADASAAVVRREFTRSVALLGIWLLVGLGLAVWNGRIARRAFEEGLLRRTSTATALLTPDMTAAAFGSSLRVARFDTHQSIAVITNAQSEALQHWREVIQNLRAANPDVPAIYVEVIRDGWLFIPVTSLNRKRLEECVATQSFDLKAFAQSKPFVEGPTQSYFGGDAFFARAPLFGSQSTKVPIAWLVFGVSATQWTAAFTQARMQAMALAGLGFVLWVVMLAYRLRREERLAADRRASAAVESERIKTAFLTKVSHELRTPIQSVLGYGELLTNTRLDEQPRRWLGALRSHGEIMLRLVNDLLDVGALDAGAFRLRPMTADFRALLAECATSLRARAEAKGLRLDLSIADDVPIWVETDPVRMRQILLNLLGNAVKFTMSGGVSLSARCVDSIEDDTATVEVVVSDTGPGIPAAKRNQLFQPFVQLCDNGEGTGLGLSLVAGLCSAMGGTVVYDDVAGSGATFRVQLPFKLGQAPLAPRAEVSAKANYHGKRIVVADDNVLVRNFLIEVLKGRGAEVVAVDNGRAAIDACAMHPAAAVILDLAMPVVDGVSAAVAIRSLPAGQKVKIIGLSAHAQPADEARARAAGMDIFLTKPVSVEQLNAAIGSDEPLSVGSTEDAAWAQVREKLWTQFDLETPLILEELRAAVRNGEWEKARARVHYLKGSADIIGASELQLACQEMLCVESSEFSKHAHVLLAPVERTANAALAKPVERPRTT